MPSALALVHATPDAAWRCPRTLRALDLAAPSLSRATVDAAGLADALDAHAGPVWLLRAGAFALRPLDAPAESATGRPLCGLGAAHDGDGARDPRWREALDATGGDLCALPPAAWSSLPLASVWLDDAARARVARSLRADLPLADALAAQAIRRVRLDALDVRFDARARVAQVITSLQHGGAERVALDLHRARLERGLPARLYAIDRPARPVFALPPGVVDLAGARRRGDAAIDEVATDAIRWGADLAHAHLLSTPAVRALAARGLAPVVTAHNARGGWPGGLASLSARDVRLLVACSLAVERDLLDARVAPPVRTAWNGVTPAPPRRPRAAVRAALGLGDAPTLVCVANPRPQKRLDRLPAILAALGDRLGAPARAVIVGDRQGRTRDALAAESALAEAVRAHGVADRIVRVDSTDDVPSYLAAADVFVSTSAFEGLSLAQVEALALGLPVVTTAVGGAPELAADHPAVRLVAEDAPAAVFADAVAAALTTPRRPAALDRFTVAAMADRYDALYARALRGGAGRGVWLVTNNFSTGGAQSSARRLLLTLRERGVPVRAATLQEHPEHPTVGRAALLRAGVRVEAIPPPEALPPARAVARLLALLDADPPEAVLLWNALAEHKLRLADALLDVRVVDVSPGEMYFTSLRRFFAGWSPRAELPIRAPADYGRRLHALVVKYAAEAPDAAAVGAPVAVIPNGVPTPPAARGSDGRRVVWGTSVRVAPQKRLELLLDALRLAAPRMPPWELRVAGGAETGSEAYAAALRERAEALPVTWLGELADVGSFLDGLDAFVMVAEPAGCPNASLEAMAAGLAVVITDVGGAREQVADGETGRVTPRDDAPALAEALVALSRDAAARARLGEGGRARARERFSVARMADDYARLCLGGAAAEAAGEDATP